MEPEQEDENLNYTKCLRCTKDAFYGGLKLMSATCGHRYCEACTKEIFSEKDKFTCIAPSCKAVLAKGSFVHDSGAGKLHDREMGIRRDMQKIYNKRREDFSDEIAYNDYLEEVEELTFNMVHRIDFEKAKARVDEYRKQNQHLIDHNQALRHAEERAQQIKINEERERLEKRKNAPQVTEETMDDITYFEDEKGKTTGSLKKASTRKRKDDEINSISNPPKGASYQPVQHQPAFVAPRPQHAPRLVPATPAEAKLFELQAARASGWSEEIAKNRAFEEAYAMLF